MQNVPWQALLVFVCLHLIPQLSNVPEVALCCSASVVVFFGYNVSQRDNTCRPSPTRSGVRGGFSSCFHLLRAENADEFHDAARDCDNDSEEVVGVGCGCSASGSRDPRRSSLFS